MDLLYIFEEGNYVAVSHVSDPTNLDINKNKTLLLFYEESQEKVIQSDCAYPETFNEIEHLPAPPDKAHLQIQKKSKLFHEQQIQHDVGTRIEYQIENDFESSAQTTHIIQ